MRDRSMVVSTASAPAPPASANPAVGPARSIEEAGARRSDGTADCHRGGEPGERLGHGRGRGGVVDHRVDGGFGRRDRGAGEQQHTPERDDAAGRWDQGQVSGGERAEDEREAGGGAGSAAEAGGEQPARERPDAPDGEQRGGCRGAVKRLGGRDDSDLVGAEQHADGDQDDHQRSHRRRAQRASARSPLRRRRSPAA